MERKKIKYFICLLVIVIATILVFYFLYNVDNKYTITQPFAQDGILKITSDDLHNEEPIFLIDGWELYKGRLVPEDFARGDLPSKKITYIGEFSNYQRGDLSKSPLGTSAYHMKIQYFGDPEIVSMEFPELFSEYELWINGKLRDRGTGSVHLNFLLEDGKNDILLNITATKGYYSGMYFPGMISTESNTLRVERIKTGFYAFAFICPLTLALFSLLLWKSKKSHIHRYFGFLCITYAMYISYYFVQLWKLPFANHWYVVEDCVFYVMCYLVIKISLEASETKNKRKWRPLLWGTIGFSCIEVVLYMMVPYFSWAVALHGDLQDIYRIILCLSLFYSSLAIFHIIILENLFVLIGNIIFGLGIMINLVNANLFEPIYSLWQFEWCGLALGLLFGAMMVVQNKRILEENAEYEAHLEKMVEQRTEQLSCVLQERRQFFSDMAHDLKAPLNATKSFVEMIKKHSIGVDSELNYYIEQVDRKQVEMSRRVQSLNELNAVDKITTQRENISINDFLEEIQILYEPDLHVNEIYFKVEILEDDEFVFMQREKLSIVFENLIYNGMGATEPNGWISIGAKKDNEFIVIKISDTGCGIKSSDQRHIFDRFYVGENNKKSGSGLGLYIVKNILEETGGSIIVSSVFGEGTTFSITLPLSTEK